jgi:hypothetical protein
MPVRKTRGLLRPPGLLDIFAFFLFLVFLCPGTSFAARSPDLVSGGMTGGEGLEGDAARLSHPALAPEGTSRTSPEAVILESGRSFVMVDLGGAKPVRALLLQADHNDSYVVEGSRDGVSWRTLWVVPAVYTGSGFYDMGLRTRTTRLPYPVEVRFLRLRPGSPGDTGGPVFSVSRFRALSSVPGDWPPEPDFSIPGARLPLFPSIGIRTAKLLMSFLAGIALMLITWSAAIGLRDGTPSGQRVRRVALGAMLVLSCLAWPNFLNFHYKSFFHLHEFYHYYVGAKYTEELRYHGLYECTAVAEVEEGRAREVSARTMRDLRTNTLVSTRGIIAEPGRCRSRFTGERWEEFKHDVRWFRERFASEERWERTQTDHGFNATPAWMVLGTPLAKLLPPSDGYLAVLSLLDMLLLAVVVAVTVRSFGLEAAVAFACFFSLSSLTSYLYNGGAFLRYDWFFSLAAGFWALRAGRERFAGFAFGYAALLRVFPGVVLAGLALRALVEMVSERSMAPLRRYRGIAVGALLSVLLLIPLSLVVTGRAGVWGEFVDNSRKHVRSESVNYIGFPYFVEQALDAPAGIVPDAKRDRSAPAREFRRHLQRSSTLLGVPAGLLMLALFGFVVRRQALWVGAVLSLALVPYLTVLSHYYFVFLAFFALLWRVRPPVAVLLCLLAWASWFPRILFESYSVKYTTLSGMVLLVPVIALLLVGLGKRSSP